MSPRVVAFVHAKGTSDRVPAKNLRVLGDRPLFLHAVEIALAARRVDEVVVDSDHHEILRLGAQAGATPLRRPAELATNLATGDDLMTWQAQSRPESAIVVQVVPTAPFLEPATVDRAVDALETDATANSVAAVASDALYTWRDGRPAYFADDGSIPNSNTLAPMVWETTGLYASRTRWVLAHHRRIDAARCRPLAVSRIEAVDINTPEDFAFAELLWHGRRAARSSRDGPAPAGPPRERCAGG